MSIDEFGFIRMLIDVFYFLWLIRRLDVEGGLDVIFFMILKNN